MKYEVSLIFSADFGVTINAESPEEAAEKAYNSDEANPSLCHQCAGSVNLGDCIRVIVYDENWGEVLDDGFEQKSINRLEKQIATLTRQRDLAVEALEAIAGRRIFIDNLASNVDIAVMTLSAIKESDGK